MRNIQLLSATENLVSQLTFEEASHILHHGLARIVKFYPYTLQLKENNPSEPDESEFCPHIPKKPPTIMPAKAKFVHKLKARGMQSFA